MDPKSLRLFIFVIFITIFAPTALGAPDAPEKVGTQSLSSVLNDLHVQGADFWIYNDFAAAVAQAKRTNQPIFVTFRCVPCKACAGFDAEVAKGSEAITKLAKEKFVSLRQVEMKGVDLSQFQFDYDLNWSAMFINADGTVYGRYGTQSADGPDAYNSFASLEKAMQRVAALHAAYPNNVAQLAEKRGTPKPYKTALEMPGLEQKEKLSGATARNNCIHCHNIHDAEQEAARRNGSLTREMLYRYPLPDNVGLHIDRNDGCKVERVIAGSPAAAAGLQAGDEITHFNGQAAISIADMQWVLHNLPNTDAGLKVSVARAGKPFEFSLKLATGWKKTDFGWRGSRWSLKPRPGFWAPELKPDELKKFNLPEGTKALRIQWINKNQPEGRKAHAVGLREGDVILAVDGKPLTMNPEQFQMHIRLDHQVGDNLPLTILREGKQTQIILPLVE